MTRDEAIAALVEKWTPKCGVCDRMRGNDGHCDCGFSEWLHARKKCAQELADALSALGGQAHRCSGCSFTWDDLSGAELCGDCWRRVQGLALGGRPETALPPEAAKALYANLDELYEGKPVGGRPETGWQPIATAPKDHDVLFWMVPKPADETYHDTNGRPILADFDSYIHMGIFGQWSSLEKALYWQPLPSPPLQEQP